MNSSSLRRTALPAVAVLTVGLAADRLWRQRPAAAPAAVAAPSTVAARPPRRTPRPPGAPTTRRPTASRSTTTRSAPAPVVENFISEAYSLRRHRRLPDQRPDERRGQGRAAPTRSRCPAYVSPIAVVFNLEGVDVAEPRRQDDRRHLQRQDHQVERPGHRRRRTPAPSCPSDRDHDGPPLRRVGHHGQLHRLPQQGRRRRVDRRARRPSGRPASRAARAPRAPPVWSAAWATPRARSATPTTQRSGRATSAWSSIKVGERLQRADRRRAPPRCSRSRRAAPSRPADRHGHRHRPHRHRARATTR